MNPNERSDIVDLPALHAPGLMLGPPGAGKTKLLMVLSTAFAQCRINEPQIEFKALNEHMTTLLGMEREYLKAGKNIAATTLATDYIFSMKAFLRDREGRVSREMNRKTFIVKDGPGGAAFPDETGPIYQEWASELYLQGKNAESLIFVIDSFNEHKNGFFSSQIFQVIRNLLVQVPVIRDAPKPNGTARARLTHWLRTQFHAKLEEPPSAPPLRSLEHCLNADRVLIVLNKIDQWCVQWSRSYKENPGDPQAGKTPRELAMETDPVGLARAVLGHKELKAVADVLKPGAKLGVAICSAGGFIRKSGDPYLDEKGNYNTLHNLDRGQLANQLCPFGVWEAMMFAAYGLEYPTVRVVRPDDYAGE